MRSFFVVFSLMLLLISCKKEQQSGDTKILDFSVTNLSRDKFTLDQLFIDDSSHMIYLFFANNIPSDSLPLQFTASFNLSTGARSLPGSGEMVTINNLDDRLTYSITAEDGTQVDYYLVLRDNQLPDCGFEDWYSATGMNGKSYSEPGKSAATTVWATANQGTSIYNIYGTKPFVYEGNTVAQITTGETSLVPVTSGTIFIGKFDITGAINHPTNPKKATKFGTPFSLRPDSIKFKYTYQPGSRYIHATLKNPASIFGGFTVTDITGSDMFTAYAILEIRDGSDIIEIGRAEVISGETQDVMKELSLPFKYSSDQKPTHISVVFASSKDGDLFTGAVGSVLTVDDVELIYK
jgi:hypothetical protein